MSRLCGGRVGENPDQAQLRPSPAHAGSPRQEGQEQARERFRPRRSAPAGPRPQRQRDRHRRGGRHRGPGRPQPRVEGADERPDAFREAHATGHNVYLRSSAQGPQGPLQRADPQKRVLHQPRRGFSQARHDLFSRRSYRRGISDRRRRWTLSPTKSGRTRVRVSTLTTIRAPGDAKIFDDHRGNDAALRHRRRAGYGRAGDPSRPRPPTGGRRTAHWNDQLTIRPLVPADSIAATSKPSTTPTQTATAAASPRFARRSR